MQPLSPKLPAVLIHQNENSVSDLCILWSFPSASLMFVFLYLIFHFYSAGRVVSPSQETPTPRWLPAVYATIVMTSAPAGASPRTSCVEVRKTTKLSHPLCRARHTSISQHDECNNSCCFSQLLHTRATAQRNIQKLPFCGFTKVMSYVLTSLVIIFWNDTWGYWST